MQILVTPKSQRAKNRVREHGDTFLLVQDRTSKICVESLKKTWQGQKWLGWFTIDDANWEILQ
jgi:hypothetical protein